MSNPCKIVYATDKAFFYLTAISLRSLMAHADPAQRYEVALLYDGIPEYLRCMLAENLQAFPHLRLTWIDINTVSFVRSNSAIYPDALFVRFAMPHIFAQDEKVLYLDGDTIVLDDVAKIFFLDISNQYVAACTDQPMAWLLASDKKLSRPYHGLSFREYFTGIVGIESPALQNYLNLGVSLWNLKKMRADNLAERCMARCRERVFLQPSQDTMFPLIKDALHILDARWNYMPFYEEGYPVQTAWEREQARKNPAIVHFARNNRPWERTGIEFEELFWKYASQTPFCALMQNSFTLYQCIRLANQTDSLLQNIESIAGLSASIGRELAGLKNHLGSGSR